MHIEFNTENLTDLDKQVLAVLAGGATVGTTVVNVSGDGDVAEKAAATAARVAAATKKAPAKTETPAEEPEDEAPAEEPVAEETGTTLEEAKAIAMDLVANGGAPKVKAALKVVGAAKVTEMDEADVPKFLAALNDA